MLASITPLGEQGRQSSYRLTVAALIAGSALAGTVVGLVLGWLGGLTIGGLSTEARAAVVGGVLIFAGLLDLGILGLRVPSGLRQVNENWIGRYRGWVTGFGFGLQLGLGFMTIVSTAAVYALFVIDFALASPLAGATVGLCFGLARGCISLLSSGVRTPTDLMNFSRLLEARRTRVRWLAAAGQVLCGAAVVVAIAVPDASEREENSVRLEEFGIAVEVPNGWDAKLYRREPPTPEDQTAPVLHIGSFALPEDDADFATSAVDLMEPGDVLIVLTEFAPDRYLKPGAGLYSQLGIPLAFSVKQFDPNTMPKVLDGLIGNQSFFTVNERPFSLLMIVGSGSGIRATVTAAEAVERARSVVASIEVAPPVAQQQERA